ncbi:hypothetical protein [Stenotrophomonas sp. B2]|uniref:hypothetical protein n=1 Tax=Stenotrophomonas sp. B2 TaxID=1537778 RepID=UPI00187534FA|nr:hypothetical protein [Stenotrophomonas sp. B2]MBE5270391.1 hypothetical protein [Stenotrophomonas sp. B2]
MKMDRDFMIFCAAFSGIAEREKSVGIQGNESEPFMLKIYGEYLSTPHPRPDIKWIDSVPAPTREWMVETIATHFLSMDEAPRWLREPSWRFIDDVPMVFVSQIYLEDNAIMRKYASAGEVLYLFSGRRECVEGWELKVKLVIQDKATPGTSYLD